MAAAILIMIFMISGLIEWMGLDQMSYLHYDFAFFYYAFHLVWFHQPSAYLYNHVLQNSALQSLHFPSIPANQYVYPPEFAVFWGWLGALPFSVASALWSILTLVVYLSALYAMMRAAGLTTNRKTLLVVFVVGLSLMPFELDLGVGNVNTILFALVAWMYYVLQVKKKPKLAGVFLGLAICFKVTPLAILLFYFLRKRYAFVVSTLITIVVLTIITILLVGMSPIWYYITHFMTFGQTSMHNGPAPYNVSVIGILGLLQQMHFLPHGSWLTSGVFAIVVVLLLAIYARYLRKAPFSERKDMAMSSLTPLVFSPLIEQSHLLYLLPALFYLIRIVRYKNKMAQRLLMIGISLLTMPVVLLVNMLANHFTWLFLLATTSAWPIAIALYLLVGHRGSANASSYPSLPGVVPQEDDGRIRQG